MKFKNENNHQNFTRKATPTWNIRIKYCKYIFKWIVVGLWIKEKDWGRAQDVGWLNETYCLWKSNGRRLENIEGLLN